jgi:hypothetical protein
MSQNVKRRNFGVMLALGMLLLVTGLSFGARPSTPAATSTGSPRQLGVAGAGLSGSAAAPAAPAASTERKTPKVSAPQVIQDIKHDTSIPLRDMKFLQSDTGRQEVERENRRNITGFTPAFSSVDPVVQNQFGPFAMPTPILTFEGINNNCGGCYPPDTNGDVGPNHYIQTVNDDFRIWDRNGNPLSPIANVNTLFSGFGGPCQLTNDGDPIVLYDQLANRWLISQFALPNYPAAPFYQCIAVSASGDPLGSWHRYQYEPSPGNLNDYPHFGVWPDGYYMTANLFAGNTFDWAGTGNYAFDRARMHQGLSAAMIRFDLGIEDWGGMLPSDMDGDTLPPASAPNTFVEVNADEWSFPGYTYYDELQIWQFHADFVTPSNSTFTGPVLRPTAAFDGMACPNFARNCVPQQGTAVKVDAITDRGMYRLAYRNMGTHESLVINHTVDVNGSNNGYTGVRWYEIRSPRSNPVIYQQGTYAPDAHSRWMGSAAMDQDGNIAIGYSVSSSTLYPSIRYAGRLSTDPLGQLAQGEAELYAGSGSQTGSAGRWGDYSMMAIDPVDDCTFWYTQEYYQTTGSTPWRTRIGKFKFPSCGAPAATPTRTNTPSPTRTATATVTGTPPSATPTVTPCPMNFSDVVPTDFFYVPVRYLYCAGIISGYADGTFRPYNPTTRGQLTKIVVLGFGIPVYTPPAPTFSDVPTTHTFYQYIETAAYEGLVSGYADGTFRPGNDVTRGQLSKITVSAKGWTLLNPPIPSFSDVPTTHTFYTYIETAFNHGIISGYADGTFRPGNNATRGQISKIVYEAITRP